MSTPAFIDNFIASTGPRLSDIAFIPKASVITTPLKFILSLKIPVITSSDIVEG